MERAAVGVTENLPRTVHVDQTIVNVDAEILIRRRREDVVDSDGHIRRDLPRDGDCLCIVCRGGDWRCVGAPVVIRCMKVDDVVVGEILVDEGVLGGQVAVRHRAEQLPRVEHRSDDDGEYGEAGEIVQLVLQRFLHITLSPAIIYLINIVGIL